MNAGNRIFSLKAINALVGIIAGILVLACTQQIELGKGNFDQKSAALLLAMKKVNGGWNTLLDKKDVEFTYTYDDKKKGTDISTERYIFEGETSWAKYEQHEVNVFPDSTGIALQCLRDGVPYTTLAGQLVEDEGVLSFTEFIRRANYFWFAMMYKLDNPGTHHVYVGTEEVNGVTYEKVKCTYDSDITGKEQNDTFVLYFNPETHLIDQFYFSLPLWGINDPILKMELDYETVDGVILSTMRRAYMPNEEGVYNLAGEYSISELKFGNGFTKESLSL